MASEGVFETKLYDKYMKKYGIVVDYPMDKMEAIRYFIECVKQNNISDEAKEKLYDMLSGFAQKNIILGGTELPIYAVALKRSKKGSKVVHDPLENVIKQIQSDLR